MTNEELRNKLIDTYAISCDTISTIVNDKAYDKLQMMLVAITNMYKIIIDTTPTTNT